MSVTSSRFRRFDLGNKAIEGIFDSSVIGAIATIASVALMAVLFLSELSMFIKVDTSSHMAIANVHEHDAVTSRLHVTFPHIHCKDLEVIADHRRGVLDNLEAAVAVDRRPASKMDRTPFELKGGVHGCTVDGTIEVERAAGAIVVHVMNHDPSRVIFSGGRLVSTRGETRHGPKGVAGPNVTHKIHDFGFGPSVKGPVGEGRNSLAGSTFVAEHGSGYVKYSLKVVPISYKRIHGTEIKTHTYSANVGFRNEDDSLKSMSSSGLVIGVEFSYDFTPVMVRYTDTRKSMFEFITSVCAIVGGIYTVSGLVVRGLRGVSRKKHD